MNSLRLGANLVLLSGVAGGVLLYRCPPEKYRFYPRCPFFRYVHLYCPGCGATRALAAMLHGRLAEAMHYNLLFVMLLPLLAVFAVVTYWSTMVNGQIRWLSMPKYGTFLLIGTTAVFAIARNL
jgi:hypothetical protein